MCDVGILSVSSSKRVARVQLSEEHGYDRTMNHKGNMLTQSKTPGVDIVGQELRTACRPTGY